MESLASGVASFTPHLGLLSYASEADDFAGVHALHEIAHALTFAQSDFYAEFAAKRLMGQKVQLKPFAPLLEAVPEVLGRLGERHAPGTLPDTAIVKSLITCIYDYNSTFANTWAAVGIDPRNARSRAGDAAGISGVKLFNRTLLLSIVDFALHRSMQQDLASIAYSTISDLEAILSARGKLLSQPVCGMTIKEHIACVLGFPVSRTITMFSDQFRIMKVMGHIGKPHFTENMILLPAVARIELFLESAEDKIFYNFFAHRSYDYHGRIEQYIYSKIRNPERIGLFRDELETLRLSFAPGVGNIPILIHPSYLEDPRAITYYTIFGLTEFIARLPKFFDFLLCEGQAGMFEERKFSKQLKEMRELSADGVLAALGGIAKKLNRPYISEINERVELENGRHSQFSEVFYLKVK